MNLKELKAKYDALQYKKNLVTEEEQLAAVKEDPWALRYCLNPSEAVQLAAVKEDPWALPFCLNPSEAVQLAAVTQNGDALPFCLNPSEAVQLAAVTQYGYAVRYCLNPSEAVQLAAVTQNPDALQYCTPNLFNKKNTNILLDIVTIQDIINIQDKQAKKIAVVEKKINKIMEDNTRILNILFC